MQLFKKVICLIFIISGFLVSVRISQAATIVDHNNWDPSGIEQSILDEVRTKRIMFMHMSVGGNMTGGLQALSSSHPSRYGLNFATNPARLTAGQFSDWYFSTGSPSMNDHPYEKVDSFDAKMRGDDADGNAFGSTADIAFMKLCFTDVESDGVVTNGQDYDGDGDKDVGDLFSKYIDTITALRQDFPEAKIILFTVPHRAVASCSSAQSWEIQSAMMKASFNQLLRDYVEVNGGYLFDIADIEAHDSEGNAVDCQGYPVIWSGWASDASGHLNAAGQERMAYALWTFLAETTSEGRVYYLSPSGVDEAGRNGRDGQEWKTFGYALGRMSEGDTLRVKSGQYDLANETVVSRRVVVNKTGVTITAADQSSRPVITGVESRDSCFEVTADNVTISHLVIKHNPAEERIGGYRDGVIYLNRVEGATVENCELAYSHYGVLIFGGLTPPFISKKITLRNCVSHHHGTTMDTPEMGNGHGFVINGGTNTTDWSDKILLENNEAYECGGDGFHANALKPLVSPYAHQYIEIKDCNFHNNDEDGIDLKNAGHVKIYGCTLHNSYGNGVVTHTDGDDGDTDDAEFYNNTVYGNGWNGVLVKSDCDNWKIWNNLIYDNAKCQDGTCADYGGGAWDRYPTYGLNLGNVSGEAYFNVLYSNGASDGIRNHGGYTGSGTIKNNALYNNLGNYGNISSGSGGTIDYNYVYPVSPGQTGTHAVTSSNPYFVNTSSGNFTLQSSSPLIGAGIFVDNYATDKAGNTRVAGSVEIGAYEYQTGGDTTFPAAPVMLMVR